MSNDDKLVPPCISLPSDNASSANISFTIVASLAVLQDRHLEAATSIVVLRSDGALATKRAVRMKVTVRVVVELGGLAESEYFNA